MGWNIQNQGWRKMVLALLALYSVLFLSVLFNPVRAAAYRITLCAYPFVLFSGLFFVIRLKWLKTLFAMFFVLPILGFCLSGTSDFDRDRLRQNYIKALLGYEDVKYVWGGENSFGIDCSGLVRIALSDAMLWQGLSTLNLSLVREGFLMWFFDSSALALRDGYGNNTQKLGELESIQSGTEMSLLPGDMAVTENGKHILVYVGNDHWLQADPSLGAVVLLHKKAKNGWFKTPVFLLRWGVLNL